MRKMVALKFRHKTKAIFAAGALFLLMFLYLFLPKTSLYAHVLRALWRHQYAGLVYYLNVADAGLVMNEGAYYFDSGAYDLEKAKKSFLLALHLEPKTQLARYQLARIYFVQGDFAKAQEYINQELALNPYNLRPLYVRGLIDLGQHNLPAAEADFKSFVAWAPGEWGGYNDLSYVLAKEGKFAESEATLTDALHEVPQADTNPWLWNSLGLAQLNQLKYKEAANSFTKALNLSQSLTLEQWRRAYSANDPSADAQSIAAFQQAIAQNLSTAKRGGIIGE